MSLRFSFQGPRETPRLAKTGAPNLGKRKVVAAAYPVNIFLVSPSLFSAAAPALVRGARRPPSGGDEGGGSVSHHPAARQGESEGKSRASRGQPARRPRPDANFSTRAARGLEASGPAGFRLYSWGVKEQRGRFVHRLPRGAHRRRLTEGVTFRWPGGGTYSRRGASQRTKRTRRTFSSTRPFSRGFCGSGGRATGPVVAACAGRSRPRRTSRRRSRE
jgi:hypothetical protein